MVEDNDKNLLKTSELRPLPFSKTVTLFDVYETDEENFEPYISPLATVGTIPSTSSTSAETISDLETTGLETGDENEEKDKGLLGGIL